MSERHLETPSHHDPKEKKKLCVNVAMVPAKITCFLSFGFFGAYASYIVVFLTSIGLSPSKAGYIQGLRQISSFICAPIWGAIVDRTGRKFLVMLILFSGIILSLFPIPWIAVHYEITAISSNCSSMSRNISSNISYNTSTDTAMHRYDGSQKLFYIMLVIFVVSSIFDQPYLALLDSTVLRLVQCYDNSTTFGQQRVLGSFGFAFTVFLSGIVIDHFHLGKFSSYSAIFFVFLPFVILSMPFGIATVKQTKFNHLRTDVLERKNLKIFKMTSKTCCRLDNFTFLVTVLIVGTIGSLQYSFLYLLMEDGMKASKTVMGLSTAVACLSEIAVFPFASYLINKLKGTINCLIIGLFSYFVRYLLFSFVSNPWLILPIQSLHSLGFALFWAAAIEHTNTISPKEITATMIGILNSLNFSLGSVIGNIVGGVIQDYFGGRFLFRGAGIVALAWCFVMLIYYHVWRRESFTGSNGIPMEEKKMLNLTEDML